MILSVLLLLKDSNHYHVTSNMEGNLEGSILEKMQKQFQNELQQQSLMMMMLGNLSYRPSCC